MFDVTGPNQPAESANEVGDDLLDFLVGELPPGKTEQAAYITLALREASARYDRYMVRRGDWLNYKTRRGRLRRVTKLIEDLTSGICELDVLTHDDLATRVHENCIPGLIGLLHLLRKQTTDLFNETQQSGRPREIAEERWIVEVADIYENAFDKPASVSGSGNGPANRRGKFYRLLELGRPTSFPRAGKLSIMQIGRVLRRRAQEMGGKRPRRKALKATVRSAFGTRPPLPSARVST
jgi:hypothetical protein